MRHQQTRWWGEPLSPLGRQDGPFFLKHELNRQCKKIREFGELHHGHRRHGQRG